MPIEIHGIVTPAKWSSVLQEALGVVYDPKSDLDGNEQYRHEYANARKRQNERSDGR